MNNKKKFYMLRKELVSIMEENITMSLFVTCLKMKHLLSVYLVNTRI